MMRKNLLPSDVVTIVSQRAIGIPIAISAIVDARPGQKFWKNDSEK